MIRSLLDRAQRAAARSRALVSLAIAIRNQARCVIKYHLAESPDVEQTGEVWLRAAIAPYANSFIDVGANVGDWIAGVIALKGNDAFSALAFEPSQSAGARLRERFAGETRLRTIDAAAGDRITTMSFLEEPNAGKGSTLAPGLGRIGGTEHSVSVTTLDAVTSELGWPRADMVKIDAEGYDARVLRGARGLLERHSIGVVQFEYNRSWQMAAETLRGAYLFLEEYGYKVFLLKRDGLYTLDYARYEEFFEYANFVAFAPEWLPRVQSHIRGTI